MGKFLRPAFFFYFLLASLFSYAQKDSTAPVIKWSVSSKKLDDKKYELTFTAPELPNIHFYAPGQDLDGIPSAQIILDSSIGIENISTTTTVETIPTSIFSKGTVQLLKGPLVWKAIINFKDIVPARLLGSLAYYYNWGETFMSDPPFTYSVPMEGGVATGGKIKISSIDIKHPVIDCGDDGAEDKSIFNIFLLGLFGGLIALITPCVFPMIPVTVTFFTQHEESKKRGLTNAILYGLFIFLFYVTLTIPFHLASNTISPAIFNNISTNVWLNIVFFVVFVAFALSFFGLYEIGLPSGLANKVHSKSHHTSIWGIFFMAGTLAIVSFSCTGPILGTLLANVANEGPWPLTAGAAGFGLALGLPFALFAMFPNWLQSLPKSGSWMTEVKVVLGFIEIALAVKFLANADNVQQWGIMKREIFVGAWVLVALAIVFYLLGWLKIGHRYGARKFSVTRIAFILFFLASAAYLAPGLTNTRFAGLRLLSGFPPPLSYSVYKNHVLLTRRIDPSRNDYDKALAKAKAENKPLLIDFTGWACQNCRRMEENVWIDKEVDSLLRNEYVVVSLYVDQRTNLPSTEQTTYKTSAGQEVSIVTVGDKWSTFQQENFNAISQPQYAIISPKEIALTKRKFYTSNPVAFADWLKCGLDAMRQQQ